MKIFSHDTERFNLLSIFEKKNDLKIKTHENIQHRYSVDCGSHVRRLLNMFLSSCWQKRGVQDSCSNVILNLARRREAEVDIAGFC
jgi:hypothetical protein